MDANPMSPACGSSGNIGLEADTLPAFNNCNPTRRRGARRLFHQFFTVSSRKKRPSGFW